MRGQDHKQQNIRQRSNRPTAASCIMQKVWKFPDYGAFRRMAVRKPR